MQILYIYNYVPITTPMRRNSSLYPTATELIGLYQNAVVTKNALMLKMSHLMQVQGYINMYMGVD